MTKLDHAGCRELLPWYVNGSLGEADREAVERHLESCVECRLELGACRDLRAEIEREAAPSPSSHPAQLQRLLERIETGDLDRGDDPPRRRAPAWGSRLRGWTRATPAPVRWLLLAQAAALLLLTLLPVTARAPEPAFRTLAAEPEPAGARRVRVVFAPATTEAEIRHLLLELRAEIVGGPSPLGAYALALARAGAGEPPQSVLQLLRSDPRVLLAEPIAGADVPPR